MATNLPANHTLYVNNLNDKVNAETLKKSLTEVFAAFGDILDIIAMKSLKRRGQAWVIFKDLQAACSAMKSLQGFPFYNKPLRIQFARTKSDEIAKADGTFVERPKRTLKRDPTQKDKKNTLNTIQPPLSGVAGMPGMPPGMAPGMPQGMMNPGMMPPGMPQGMPGMPQGMPDFSNMPGIPAMPQPQSGMPQGMMPPPMGNMTQPAGMPMSQPGMPSSLGQPGMPQQGQGQPGMPPPQSQFGGMPPTGATSQSGLPPAAQSFFNTQGPPSQAQGPPMMHAAAATAAPNRVLFVENIPPEANDTMLTMLFRQYPGFMEVRLIQGRNVAFVDYNNDMQAGMAMQGLNGFQINPTTKLMVSYARK